MMRDGAATIDDALVLATISPARKKEDSRRTLEMISNCWRATRILLNGFRNSVKHARMSQSDDCKQKIDGAVRITNATERMRVQTASRSSAHSVSAPLGNLLSKLAHH